MGKAKTKSDSRKFYNKHDDQMREFFAKAQQEYASGAAKPQVGEDGSSRIVLCDGLWRYVDLWYGDRVGQEKHIAFVVLTLCRQIFLTGHSVRILTA